MKSNSGIQQILEIATDTHLQISKQLSSIAIGFKSIGRIKIEQPIEYTWKQQLVRANSTHVKLLRKDRFRFGFVQFPKMGLRHLR